MSSKTEELQDQITERLPQSTIRFMAAAFAGFESVRQSIDPEEDPAGYLVHCVAHELVETDPLAFQTILSEYFPGSPRWRRPGRTAMRRANTVVRRLITELDPRDLPATVARVIESLDSMGPAA